MITVLLYAILTIFVLWGIDRWKGYLWMRRWETDETIRRLVIRSSREESVDRLLDIQHDLIMLGINGPVTRAQHRYIREKTEYVTGRIHQAREMWKRFAKLS